MERKFALFDIDKTLIRGDSLFALYFYGAKKWPVYWLWLPVIPFAGLLYALRILPVERVKRIFYAPLRRFSEGDFADFFDRYILALSLIHIFICSGFVFCASSRMIKDSSSVRPRI